jgi:alpha-beta hydrolase superfamily lysophospholipase
VFSLRQKIQMTSWFVILISAFFAAALYSMSEWVLHPPEYRPATPGGHLPKIEEGSVVWAHYRGLASDPRTDFGYAFEDVEFQTVGGGVLRGWFVPAGRESTLAVVTIHGAYFDRRDFMRRLPMLHDSGYPVLMFDCREHGTSSGTGRGPGIAQREFHDVLAAIVYLTQERGFSRIALFGQSQGAVSAIIAASRDPSIVAVIAENPFATMTSRDFPPPGMADVPWWIARPVGAFVRWRADAIGGVEAVDVVDQLSPRPFLLMHGGADQIVPASHSQLLYEKAGEPKQLWIGLGADHDALINVHADEYERRVLSFLSDAFHPKAQ